MSIFLGCDSGFGFKLAKRLDEKGFVVFAGCLLPDREGAQALKKECSDRLHITQVDVTDEWLVRGAFKYIKENLGDNGTTYLLLMAVTISTFIFVEMHV